MTTEERVRKALDMFQRAGPTQEFTLYFNQLKIEDQLAFSLVDVYLHLIKDRYFLAVRKGMRLIPRVSGSPWLAWRLFTSLGSAHMGMGEMDTAENYIQRALEMAELSGDKEAVYRTKFQICGSKFFRGEYEHAYKSLMIYGKEPGFWRPYVHVLLGTLTLIRGNPDEAIRILRKIEEGIPAKPGAGEIKALAFRITGKFPDAMEAFIESAMDYITYGSSYSVFPVAKALELARLAGLDPPPADLIRKALRLAKRGSWGEQAAVEEIEALLKEDDSEAARGLFGAAGNYLRAYQHIEALFSGLTASYLAWKTDSPIFTKALKLIAPLVPLHPGFKKDPLLGDFINEVGPLLAKSLKPNQETQGIKVYLIGEFRVFVDGKEIRVAKWHRNKAIKAFVYLLLSSKHRLPVDHLFYLLWPRKAYNRKNKYGLYTAINTIRKHLGRAELLVQTRDFYQLEGDVWTDLGELEDIIRRADATLDPAEKEELLSRARELARGELLPEFPYDRYIDEYRQYYERLRKRVFGEIA